MKILLPLFITFNVFATNIQDLTDNNRANERFKLYNQENLPGVRVAILGLKQANSIYGLGSVNKSIKQYEQTLSNAFEHENIKIIKTDFKGYYITCAPMPTCMESVNEKLKSTPFPKIDKDMKLGTTHVLANNYKEGYLKARIKSFFPNQSGPLEEFIEKELVSAITEASDSKGIDREGLKDPQFRANLDAQIEQFRKDGASKLDPKYKRLVLMLDLLEIPYSSSTNIDNELENALKAQAPSKGIHTISAQTGDDLFLIIKKGDSTLRAVGADAKGLGKTNMITRFEEYTDHLSSGYGIKDMNDVFKLSTNAINKADAIMDESMETYKKLVNKELRFVHPKDLDKAIKKAHDKYILHQKNRPELMPIRAGSLDNCSNDPSRLMNRIGAIHNRLKQLESAGFKNTFGGSCIDLELKLLKKGLK